MDMQRYRWTAFLALALILVSAAVHAQPAGDAPKINVGDQWTFARTEKASGKADTWSRTVVEAPGEDQLRVKLGSGTVEDYDGAMNFMPQGNPDFRRALAVYPLTVGKEWSIARSSRIRMFPKTEKPRSSPSNRSRCPPARSNAIESRPTRRKAASKIRRKGPGFAGIARR
jgi:hypothetical protein